MVERRLKELQQGNCDDLRGRKAQHVLKEWCLDLSEARRVLKDAHGEAKKTLNSSVTTLDKAIAFVRAFSKLQQSAPEMKKAADEFKTCGGQLSVKLQENARQGFGRIR